MYIKLTKQETALWESDGPVAEAFRTNVRQQARNKSRRSYEGEEGSEDMRSPPTVEILANDGVVLDAQEWDTQQ